MSVGPAFFIALRSLLGRRIEVGSQGSSTGAKVDAKAKKKHRKTTSTGGFTGAILGIGISLVPIILVLTVSDGMIQGITNRYMETKTYHLQISIPDNLGIDETEKGRGALKAIPGVLGAFKEMNGSAVAVSATTSHATLLRAIDSGYYEDPGTRKYLKVLAGTMIPSSDKDIVLGSSLASSLNVKLGDTVTLITPSESANSVYGYGDSSGTGPLSGYSPRLSFFKVSGIVSAGYRDLDALWAFISPRTGEKILSYPSAYSFWGIKVKAPFSNDIGVVRDSIVSAFKPLYPDWFDGFLVRTWPEIEKNLYKSFGTTKSLLMFIMGITLLVAAVNLGSALSTFVAEHSLDIAVMRSMGAADATIRRIFLDSGLITGILGTALGILCGLFLSINVNAVIRAIEWIANIFDAAIAFFSGQPSVPFKLLDPDYYLETIPVTTDYRQIALIAGLSIILCVVASLLPARKATRISVQELIRKS